VFTGLGINIFRRSDALRAASFLQKKFHDRIARLLCRPFNHQGNQSQREPEIPSARTYPQNLGILSASRSPISNEKYDRDKLIKIFIPRACHLFVTFCEHKIAEELRVRRAQNSHLGES
jgi:hypothetical protein